MFYDRLKKLFRLVQFCNYVMTNIFYYPDSCNDDFLCKWLPPSKCNEAEAIKKCPRKCHACDRNQNTGKSDLRNHDYYFYLLFQFAYKSIDYYVVKLCFIRRRFTRWWELYLHRQRALRKVLYRARLGMHRLSLSLVQRELQENLQSL